MAPEHPDPTRPHGGDVPPPDPGAPSPWGAAPQPGYGGHDPSAPTQPRGEAWQGYPAPAGPSGPSGPSGPGKGLLVTLVGVAAVLVVAVGVGLVLVLGGGDDVEPVAAGDPTVSTTGSATGSPTGATTVTTPPEPTDTTTPDATPTGEAAPPPSGDRVFSYRGSIFDDDWNFRYGDVALKARYVEGWDYDGCGDVEVDGAITDLGCTEASEITYRALDGHVALTHLVLVFGTAEQAAQAVPDLVAGTFEIRDESKVSDEGTFIADNVGEIVVLTAETHEDPVTQEQADPYRAYANTDFVAALRFSS
ncbi:MAG: hypothetical protein CMH83_18240 [Nocardioides sp.]|nr:hypothetical protein [Nocardioides sp.]